jgi:plasmid stability protein
MAQTLIRKLNDETLADYRLSAKEKGRSLEAELRETLERNRPRPKLSPEERHALSLRLTDGQKMGSDSTPIIREVRDQRFGDR